MSIHVRDISKSFGSFKALDNVSLDVPDGTLLALLGPSGSGKTTLLRIIAGLEFPDAGVIEEDGEDITERHARQREVGFVFQHYALFRHMTVFENVAFGLRVVPRARRLSRAAIAERVGKLLDLVQLGWLADRYPSQLSGGQRQRVALARALAIEPKVLLLDEPFGALDAKVRKELRRWLRDLHADVNVTSVFVTHDQEEALELADRVVVMSAGKIEQIGTPNTVYAAPASAFVHEFLGETNRIECRIDAGRVLMRDGTLLGRTTAPEGAAITYVRPHDLQISPGGPARVISAVALGPLARVTIGSGSDVLEAAVAAEDWTRAALIEGAPVALSIRRGMVFSAAATVGLPVMPIVSRLSAVV
jgi:sulfate transport system ATP-binding protein